MDVTKTVFWVFCRIITCSLNLATGGSFYEAYCSRVWRRWAHQAAPYWYWSSARSVLDFVFFFDPDHCWKQYLKTANRKVKNKWNPSWLWETF